MNVKGVKQPLLAGLYADDTVLFAESEGMLQRIVDEFDICRRRKLKVNEGKSKVMIFERPREQTIDFAKPYRLGSEVTLGCKIWIGKEKMEVVNEFKYLGTILCLRYMDMECSTSITYTSCGNELHAVCQDEMERIMRTCMESLV